MTDNLPKLQGEPNLIQASEALWKSGLFPNVKNAYGAFAIVEYGHELGIGPMTSLQTMAIINGKICMAAQMMLSLALQKGVKYEIVKDTQEEAVVTFKRDSMEYQSSFTLTEAKQAGIFRERSGWDKFPRDMLFWRAVTRGLRRVAPDVITGLYAIEEIKDAPPLNAEVNIPETEPDTTKNFEWLKQMQDAKKFLGDTLYYDILGHHGYEKSSLVLDPQQQTEILAEMRNEYKKQKEAVQGVK